MQRIEEISNFIMKVVSYIGSTLLIVMMLLSVADVSMRYTINHPILGTVEITKFLMVMISFLVLGQCTWEKGHVMVDFLVSRLSHRIQQIISLVAYILYLALYIPITWSLIPETTYKWHIAEKSMLLDIPVYPFYIIATFGCFVVCLALFIHLFKIIAGTIKNEHKP